MKVALALGALTALVLLPGASAAGAFVDPRGDQADKPDLALIGPDITNVEIDHTSNVLGFRVTIGNYAAMPPSSRIAIVLDLDKDIATGDQGFEHALKYDVDAAGASRVTFERFEPSQFSLVAVPGSRVTGEFAGGVLTALVPRAELGSGADFEFGVYAVRFGQSPRDFAGDVAPNANLWRYDVVEARTVRLAASTVAASPKRPLAGRPFTISSIVTRLDTGSRAGAGSIRCRVTLAGVALRARGSFRGGSARCTMTIPGAARGKSLAGSMTVRAHGAVVTRRFSFRVR